MNNNKNDAENMDLVTVEKNKNDNGTEEFPEGAYGSPIIHHFQKNKQMRANKRK